MGQNNITCTLALRCQRNSAKFEKTSLSTDVVRGHSILFYPICTTYTFEYGVSQLFVGYYIREG
jgi:hypothetical protein